MDSLRYFSFQPVLHDWYNKGSGICYSVFGMVHIKELMLLIRKGNPCSGVNRWVFFAEWFFTICLMTYNHKQNVLIASLNKKLYMHTGQHMYPNLCYTSHGSLAGIRKKGQWFHQERLIQ